MSLTAYLIIGLCIAVAVLAFLWWRESSLRGRAEARAESLGIVARESMDAHDETVKILEKEKAKMAVVDKKHDEPLSKIKEVSAKIDMATSDREKIAGMWSKAFKKSE